MDDGKHSFDKLVHVQNLLQVFLAQLRHLQHAESQKVVPNLTGVKLQIQFRSAQNISVPDAFHVHKYNGMCIS